MHQGNHISIGPTFRRRFLPVWLAGVAATLTLLSQPLPRALLADSSLPALPVPLLKLLMLANPLILVTMLAAAGAATAHRVGLQSVLAGTAKHSQVAYGSAITAGLVMSLFLVVVDRGWTSFLDENWQEFAGRMNSQSQAAALVAGLGYGGVTEEVMLRWGVMSVLVWLLAKLGAQGELGPQKQIFVIAGVLSALLFALGHLPALAHSVDLTPGVVARTLTLNVSAGILYAWLYWRGTLETAMVAHASSHVGLAIVRALT